MAEAAVSPKARTRPAKKNQIPYAAAVLVGIIVIGIILGAHSSKAGLMWIFGSALGFVLQKSRFCFTASMRDPVLTGSTSLTRAVIIALAVATAGFASVQYAAYLKNPVLAGIPGNINPVGWHTAIGAAMFGIGMVIAGGCASGTLMRMGEGFMQQWLAIVAFIGGSVWAAHDFGWWQKVMIDGAPKVWLPKVVGWPTAVFGQLLLLGVLYIFADWYDKRRNKVSE